METIIVSACLLGDKCRYDGKGNYNENVKFLREHFNIVPICPEQFGGLSTPRDPCEIRDSVVVTEKGKDCTKYYEKGRDDVINIVKYLHIRKAVLAEKSPSCGVKQIYNGRFNGTLIDGQGITTRALQELGVACYTIDEVEKLIDKTQKQIYEEREAIILAKEKENAEKAAKNAEYSKMDNKITDNFNDEKIIPYDVYKRSLGIKDEYTSDERPQGDRRSYGSRNRSYGDRPSYGNRSNGNRSYTKRSYSDRPSYNNRSSEGRSYGNRTTGDRKYDNESGYRNRKFGDKKPYSNRSSSSTYKKRSYTPNKEEK